MKLTQIIRPFVTVITLAIGGTCLGEVKLPPVIGDHMVLQRDREVPIWGLAGPDEQVTVRFASQEKTARADATGQWQVKLAALPASAQPATMTIAGSNTIEVKNVLVGEVWLCSGQSNMEFPMKPPGQSLRALPPLIEAQQQANFPQIRLFKVEKNDRAFTTRGWAECTPESVGPFSAVGFFFGRDLHQKLNVPIGLIQSAWGGSHIERWTPAEAYEKHPAFASQATSKPVRIDNQRAGQYFEPMVRPLAPFAIRGLLWYQGESNIIATNDRMRYFDKFKAMVDSWRSIWGQGDFPVYFVQLAPYNYSRRNDPLKHSVEELPYLWEAQVASLKIPNTGMAATTDIVDNLGDIHPPNKWDVGHRLALIALAKDYGIRDIAYAGPMFKSADFQDGKAIVHFTFTGSARPELATRDGEPPTDFTIAGEDGEFRPATAKIEGGTIIVSSPEVAAPKSVRFGWRESAQPNLVDKHSMLPAVPFRSDTGQ